MDDGLQFQVQEPIHREDDRRRAEGGSGGIATLQDEMAGAVDDQREMRRRALDDREQPGLTAAADEIGDLERHTNDARGTTRRWGACREVPGVALNEQAIIGAAVGRPETRDAD